MCDARDSYATSEGAVVVGLPLSGGIHTSSCCGTIRLHTVSELVQRPEIDSALKGTPSTALRRGVGNQRVLYAAAPVYTEDGQINGIVYIATLRLDCQQLLSTIGRCNDACCLIGNFCRNIPCAKDRPPFGRAGSCSDSNLQGISNIML